MRVAEGRTRFGNGFGPATYFATLTAVLVLAVALLLVFPARALAAAELSIRKDGPSRVEPGERFDYVLTVTNEGEDPAADVKVEDELPAGVTFEKAKVPAGVACTPPPAVTVTCDIANLDAGESKQITLTVIAPASAGVIENEARASIVGDPDSARDSNKLTTTVAPRLVIRKLDDPDPVDTEDILLYTLRVENVGGTAAKGIIVRDELPLDKVDFVTVDSNDFDCQYKAGIVRCTRAKLPAGKIGKIEIAVEPEKAGTLQNRADVFVQGVREPLDTDTERTVVKGGGGGGGGGDGGGGGGGGSDLPEGEQCSPVVEEGTENPIGVLSGTTQRGLIFTNVFNDVLPLRIVYATSSENGSLTFTAKPEGGGEQILDRTIQGKKRGVIIVETDPAVDYEILISPENQGYAVKFEMGVGPDPCTNPDDLDPPGGPGDNGDGNETGNETGDGAGDGADDVIDETISDNPLPSTGGPSLLGLAVVSLGIAAVGGATVVRTGVRRRDR